MSKHTPTPWRVVGEDECPEDIPVIEVASGKIPSKEYKQIAYIQPSDDGDVFYLSDEDRANAARIVSSVNFTEGNDLPDGVTLKDVLEEFTELLSWGDFSARLDVPERASAILAKFTESENGQ